jgi:SAM-dependent methyltransferase
MKHPKILKRAWHALQRSRTKALRRFGWLGGDWKEALPEELGFWEWALKNGGQNWKSEEYQERTNPNFELQDELKALIPAAPGANVRIFDVGSGPLTRVGKRWAGRDLQIVAVDPLADEYNALLDRISLRPLVPASFCHGEKLTERFEPNSFDLAYASNSLDHSYDPMVVIRQMLAVVKPSHYVYLWHFANAGVLERYTGLHQWNFEIHKGDVTLGNGQRTFSITDVFQTQAEVACESQTAFGSKVIVTRLKKLAAS